MRQGSNLTFLEVFMDCYVCQAPLIWGGDDDAPDNTNYAIETNLSCPECDALYFVLHGNGLLEED
jgi:hypothetical protein